MLKQYYDNKEVRDVIFFQRSCGRIYREVINKDLKNWECDKEESMFMGGSDVY